MRSVHFFQQTGSLTKIVKILFNRHQKNLNMIFIEETREELTGLLCMRISLT
jgi:hypothetical protein